MASSQIMLLPRGMSDNELKFQAYAAKACAIMWNTLDVAVFQPLLADDVVYESQNVLTPLGGTRAVSDYLKGKIATLVKAGPSYKPHAELGVYQGQHCVTIAQGEEEPVAVILFAVRDDKIKRVDLCSIAPRPQDVDRSGVYPESF